MLYHSALSPLLNTGLLSPAECVEAAVAAYQTGAAPLNSVEGFVRQIIGWREFINGIYWHRGPEYKELNSLGAERPLPAWFYTAETPMNCLHRTLQQTLAMGWNHHIQRLMVLGNFFLIAGVRPQEALRWYLEMYVDAYDWVMAANVIGLSLHADGGYMATKPYAAGSGYIRKMSDYCRGCRFDPDQKTGPDACPFNYLYWNFLDQHADRFIENQRMRMIVTGWLKRPEADREAVRQSAQTFLAGHVPARTCTPARTPICLRIFSDAITSFSRKTTLSMTDEQEPALSSGKRSEERFKILVESVKDYGIFTLDCDGYITSWNEGARRIKGYERHEIVGSHFSRFYTAEDLAAGKPQWELERALADGRVEDEGWRVRKDGTLFWADVVITALFDPETGEHRGFGKVTRDLTERKQHEERLRQSEEQFRLLVERVDEYAIFMLDPTGHIATWNSGAQKIKQYPVEEIVGEHFERFYLPEDRAAGKPQRLLKIAEEEGHVHDQGVRMRKDGTTFHADVLITAVRDRTGTLRGFSKVTRDITDQMRGREAEAARLVAEKANKAKDEFLAVLSHELRTPLTPVLANAEYLIANLDEISREEEREMLGAIQRNARLEAQLIDDLLDLTRISRGKIELKFEAVDVHAAIADAISILTPQFGEKGLALRNELTARDHWMWGDPTRLRQVFWNLLTNAVKFTPAGGQVVVRSFIDSSARLVVEVGDSGIGIEPDQLARIFNAFEQGERKVTRQFGGLGLGLAITRSIVQMHHGVIAASSAGQGKGAVFQLRFASVSPGQIEQAAAGPIVFGPQHLRLLLVDDHQDTRRILASLLRKIGHTVEAAENVSSSQVRPRDPPLRRPRERYRAARCHRP